MKLEDYQLFHKRICIEIIRMVNECPPRMDDGISILYSKASFNIFKSKVFCSSVGCLYNIKKLLNLLEHNSLSCEDIPWEKTKNIPELMLCDNCLFVHSNKEPAGCLDGLWRRIDKEKSLNKFVVLIEELMNKETV